MKVWLRFFRFVNVPTVPGDILVGAAVMIWGVVAAREPLSVLSLRPLALFFAALASVFIYLFGLADNDIVGAATDGPERPISAGELSMGAARLARGLSLLVAMALGALADLPPLWWYSACALLLAITAYNRTRWCVLMGLCRALNVLSGAGAVLTVSVAWVKIPLLAYVGLGVVLMAAFLYVTLVTRYSATEGEHLERRQRMGLLLGAIVYLQLTALIFFYLYAPHPISQHLLWWGAALLILLRLFKRLMPNVSAS